MWKPLDRLRTLAGLGNWANATVNAVLYWKIIVSAMSAIGMAAWAFAERVPWVLVVALALVTFAAVIWAWNGITWRIHYSRSARPPDDKITADQNAPFVDIANRIFINETVRLDGKRFISCTFDACTIQWDGGNFSVLDPTWKNGWSFISANPTIARTLPILKWLKLFDDKVYVAHAHLQKPEDSP